jgi:hypothetical protein
MNKWSAWLSLFVSTGTLFCCALPSLLVALGMGAVMVGLISTIPQLVWLSQHKLWVFAMSGLMILGSGVVQLRARSLPCPIDPRLAHSCQRTRLWSERVLILSAMTWIVGAFFAFIAPLLL